MELVTLILNSLLLNKEVAEGMKRISNKLKCRVYINDTAVKNTDDKNKSACIMVCKP